MTKGPLRRFPLIKVSALVLLLSASWSTAFAQTVPVVEPPNGLELYRSLRDFHLTGGTAQAHGAVLKRDRVEMTFDGTFYLEPPIAGRVRGAAFVGRGTVKAECPPGDFAKANLRLLLKADGVYSDFSIAVLRFTDDSMEALGLQASPGRSAPALAQKAATALAPRVLRETGANLPARMVVSILNREMPGVFFAQFAGGALGRFNFLLDSQSRLLSSCFGLDAGEKGLLYAYNTTLPRPHRPAPVDIWMAFRSLEDYQSGRREYPESNALVQTRRYDMTVDVRNWKQLRAHMRISIVANRGGVRAFPLMLNETLSIYDFVRQDYGMKVQAARLPSGEPLTVIQEPSDCCFTLQLPRPLEKGETLEPVLDLKGRFLVDPPRSGVHLYFVGADGWYPRASLLDRASFHLTFLHSRGTSVASLGELVREEKTRHGDRITEWKMDSPVPAITFVLGEFELHTEKMATESGREVLLEYYSLPEAIEDVNEDFLLAEMGNSLRYFSALFGPYTYPQFRAIISTGIRSPGIYISRYTGRRAFPTTLLLPPYDLPDGRDFYGIGQEVAGEWWGGSLAPHSHRDLWLIDGLAAYSGILYTARRDPEKIDVPELLTRFRDSLLSQPWTGVGNGKGYLVNVGPPVAGNLLFSRETIDAERVILRAKSAYIFRMLNFIFSDPGKKDTRPFFAMLQDFSDGRANSSVSTEDFQAVANRHFADAPIAKEYGLKDLDWFFRQWVYQTGLPSYSLRYHLESADDGSSEIIGVVRQKNVGEDWQMVLPLAIHFSGGKVQYRAVLAQGPASRFSMKIPGRVERVELDPDRWILSERTTTQNTH